MLCPECSGAKIIQLIKPDMWDARFDTIAGEIICPTCEGQGTIPDTHPAKHCPACGEPLSEDQDWCDEHSAAVEKHSSTD